MSPRRARRREDEVRPLQLGSFGVTESHADGDWVVQRLTAAQATKTYRCPGCDQEIRPGLPHVVAWRPGDEDGRRHWHTPCWSARQRRRPR